MSEQLTPAAGTAEERDNLHNLDGREPNGGVDRHDRSRRQPAPRVLFPAPSASPIIRRLPKICVSLLPLGDLPLYNQDLDENGPRT